MAPSWKGGWVQALRGSNPLSSAQDKGSILRNGAFCVSLTFCLGLFDEPVAPDALLTLVNGDLG